MPEAQNYEAAALRLGMKVTYEVEITEEDILTFVRLTGDSNPVHVNTEYARKINYQDRIVHGAFQVSLASALLGMHLPGKRALLGTINSRFSAPLYFPCRARISGEIVSWSTHTLGGQLRVIIQETSSLTTTAEINMGFALHQEQPPKISEDSPLEQDDTANEGSAVDDKLIVLTGASGGLGTSLVAALARNYHVLAVINEQSLDTSVVRLPNVREVRMNISSPDLEAQLSAVIEGRALHGLIHAAWPGAPRGSLLQSDDDLINGQIAFGTTSTVRLARILFQHAPPNGGRFVAVGSTAGTFKPNLQLGVYSLGKACLEQTVRLLAPELARKKVTINAVCPSFMSVGINEHASERQMLMESATIPMGRLCSTEDVVGTIEYLLSPQASFVSGQVLMLTGGQL